MDIENCKITAYQDNVKDLPDVVTNSAAMLKAVFDGRTDKEVKERHNALIEYIKFEILTRSQVAEAIAQAVFEAGAADMTKAVFCQAGEETLKDNVIPKATKEQAKAGEVDNVFLTPLTGYPLYPKVTESWEYGVFYVEFPVETEWAKAYNTLELEANTIYELPEPPATMPSSSVNVTLSEITVTFGSPANGHGTEYILAVKTGATDLTINLPAGALWQNGKTPTFGANKLYLIVIAYIADEFIAAAGEF